MADTSWLAYTIPALIAAGTAVGVSLINSRRKRVEYESRARSQRQHNANGAFLEFQKAFANAGSAIVDGGDVAAMTSKLEEAMSMLVWRTSRLDRGKALVLRTNLDFVKHSVFDSDSNEIRTEGLDVFERVRSEYADWLYGFNQPMSARVAPMWIAPWAKKPATYSLPADDLRSDEPRPLR